MNLSKKDIQIRFIGENAFDVTGSMIWVKTPDTQILLECGLYQKNGNDITEYHINNAAFPFKPQEIDYVFINHTHIDHCGRLPLLFKRGCKAQVIVPENNLPILEVLLNDSAKACKASAASLTKQNGNAYPPIYTYDDVQDALAHVTEYAFNTKFDLGPFTFRFVSSGHILGSAQLELWIDQKKILYTSDLGNIHIKKSYVADFVPVEKANIVIGESTYGGESLIAGKKMRKNEVQLLSDTIFQTCMIDKAKVLIPVFANSRAQEMLTQLYDIISEDPMMKRIPVFLDSPMANAICGVYDKVVDDPKWKKVREWINVRWLTSVEESNDARAYRGPAVILAASGMMTNGRVRSWCRDLLPNSNNTIVFCGFAVEDSLAYVLKLGKKKKIKLSGEWIRNRAKIVDLRSYTSHMQQDDLIKYYSSIKCERVFLVHGEENSKLELQSKLRDAIHKNDMTHRVYIPQKDEIFTM